MLYYQHINRAVRDRIGGFHSAPLLLHSVDFAYMERYQRENDWKGAEKHWGDAAKGLVSAGAQAVMLCCNTFHVIADEVEQAAGVPLIHIVHATAEKIKEQGLSTLILIGTMSTMNSTFYPELMKQHNLKCVVPDQAGKDEVQRVIFEELIQGVVKPSSRESYFKLVQDLAQQHGAEGLILGCTEIGMLIDEKDVGMPLFDTCKIHAEKAVSRERARALLALDRLTLMIQVEWAIANRPVEKLD